MDYQQQKQTLNQQLSEKVQNELSAFREEVLNKSPQEIYDAAYQIAIKNDISQCFPDTDYSPQTAKVLMKSPNLLQDIYEEWMGRDDCHMEDLRQTIKDFKDYMVKIEKMLSGKER